MQRFMTVETYAGDITVHPDGCDSAAIIAGADVAEWIWQVADTPEQATAQHYDKHDEWRDDIDAGRNEKDTY